MLYNCFGWIVLRHPLFRQGRRRHTASAKSCRPHLEDLESRQLPSAFTVTNTGDSGPGSLR